MQQSPQTKFFNTESQNVLDQASENLLKNKSQLGTYVGKLDFHINKAMNFQNRTLSRKRQNLLETLQKMKDQIYRESEKTRKMEEFFYNNCEKILKNDINKWESNEDFFTKVFELYDSKIKQKKSYIDNKKKEIDRKTRQLKQTLRNNRNSLTVQQLSQRVTLKLKQRSSSKNKKTLQTEDSTARETRIKTQTSLPALSRPLRVKTMIDCEQNHSKLKQVQEMKNYMKPIKTEKILLNPESTKQNLLEMLSWYKNDKEQYNWFEKLLFVDRNFVKIVQFIQGQ